MTLNSIDGLTLLQLVSNDEIGFRKKKGVIYLLDTCGSSNNLRVVPERSDISDEDISKLEHLLNCPREYISVESYVCEIDLTSILVIDQRYKISDSRLLEALFLLGTKTKQINALDSITSSQKLTQADDDYKEKIRLDLEKTIHSIPPETRNRLIQQYCWKFGDINFFGWAEKVYVDLILSHQQPNFQQ